MSSPQNPVIKGVRRLLRRAGRDDARAFLIEGARSVVDLLAAGHPVDDVFVTEQLDVGPELERAARGAGARVHTVAPTVMRAISDTVTPQGAVAVAPMPDVRLDDLPAGLDLVLVIDGVSDPGNAGTLLRSAVAAGADAVVFAEGSADPFSPKTVRAAAGAVFGVPIVRGGAIGTIASALRETGLRIVAADATAGRDATTADLTAPLALVVGNESWGIDDRLEVDEGIAIVMPGSVESLNVGVAGSILLFEATRQRRSRTAAVSSTDHG
ncbi:MAG TPA: RNA methyltransferase [Actinomycetota bacterium]|nr:RNA methyltransferase [Actinomycetota bacterium]